MFIRHPVLRHPVLHGVAIAGCLLIDCVGSAIPAFSTTMTATAQTRPAGAAPENPSVSRRITFNGRPGYIRDLSYKMDIGHVAFDPTMEDSNTIRFCVGFSQGEVRCYTFDRETLQTRNWSCTHESAGITFLAYSGDGALLASGDQKGTVRIWKATDQDSQVPYRIFREQSGPVSFLKFTRDSSQLMSASEGDRTVRVWDVVRDQEIRELRADRAGDSEYRIVAYLPDGGSFLGAPALSAGDSVVFRSQDGRGMLAGFDESGATMRSFSLGEDSLRLSAKVQSGDVTRDSIWYWNDQQPETIEALGQDIFAAGISGDKKVVLTSMTNGDFVLWNVDQRLEATRLLQGTDSSPKRRFNFVTVSPKGEYAATFVDKMHLQLWHIPPLPHPGHIRTYYVDSHLFAVSLSFDGSIIAVGTATGIKYWPFDQPASRQSWFDRPKESNRQKDAISLERPVTTLVFTPNATEVTYGTGQADEGGNEILGMFVTDKYGKKVQKTSVGLRRFDGHTDSIVGAGVISSGDRLISASRDQTVRAWSLEVGLEDGRLTFDTSVNDLDVSPDQTRALVAADDGTVRVVDVETLTETARLTGHLAAVLDVDWAPDGSHFVSASADKTIRVWNAESLEIIAVLNGHTDRVNSSVSTTWGRYVVSGSADGTVRYWDVDLQREVAVFNGHEKPVTEVTLDPFESRAVSCSLDRTVKVWDLTRFRHAEK